MIINPFTDRSQRQPNSLQTAASEFFGQLNTVRNEVKENIAQTKRQIIAITKKAQKRLSNKPDDEEENQ